MVRNSAKCDWVPIVEEKRGGVVRVMSPPAHNNIPLGTAPPGSLLWGVFQPRLMLWLGTVRRALAPPCLSTGTRSDRHFADFPVACAGGGHRTKQRRPSPAGVGAVLARRCAMHNATGPTGTLDRGAWAGAPHAWGDTRASADRGGGPCTPPPPPAVEHPPRPGHGPPHALRPSAVLPAACGGGSARAPSVDRRFTKPSSNTKLFRWKNVFLLGKKNETRRCALPLSTSPGLSPDCDEAPPPPSDACGAGHQAPPLPSPVGAGTPRHTRTPSPHPPSPTETRPAHGLPTPNITVPSTTTAQQRAGGGDWHKGGGGDQWSVSIN